jgi:hypothetical protein
MSGVDVCSARTRVPMERIVAVPLIELLVYKEIQYDVRISLVVKIISILIVLIGNNVSQLLCVTCD